MNKLMHSLLSVPTRRQFFKGVFAASGVALGASVPLLSSHLAYASGPVPVSVFRLYNSQSKDHLYSFQKNEGTSIGYILEEGGEAAYHIYAQSSGQQPGTVQFVRLFSTAGGHFYTADPQEVSDAQNQGFRVEANFGWVYPTTLPQPAGTTPLFRLYQPTVARHFYTTNVIEQEQARENGFNDEGTACYVFA